MSDAPLMAGKVVLVTGATGGIGKARRSGSPTMGARVGITGRDLIRAEQAAADIRTASGNQAVDVFAADMSSQAEVRRLAPMFSMRTHAGCAGQQRRRFLGAPTSRLPTAWSTPLPSTISRRSCSPTCAGSAQGAERTRTGRDWSSGRRPRAESTSTTCRALAVTGAARVQPIEAGQHPVHQRVGSPSSGTGVTANSVHPGVVRTKLRLRRPGRVLPDHQSLVRPFLRHRGKAHGRRSSGLNHPGWRGSLASSLPTASPRRQQGRWQRGRHRAALAVSTDLVGLTGSPR